MAQIFPEQGPALLAPELLGQMLLTLVGADQPQGAATAEGGGAAASAVTAAYTLVVGRVICLDAGNARIEIVGKSQSCMVSKLRWTQGCFGKCLFSLHWGR